MKKIVTTFALLLVFSVMLFSFLDVRIAKTEANMIVVPDDYSTIQEAIDAASEGDTIFVKRGTYHEHLQVDKSLSLVGEDRETTIIDGDNVGQVVNITACDHVNMTGFTIRNSGPLGEGYSSAGIGLWGVNYCNISVNKVTTNAFGIVAIASYNNIVFGNIIEENSGSGVAIDGWGYPNYNSIHGNEIVNNIGGVEISSGKNNTIYENNITKNGNEIILDDSHNNSILRNNVGGLGPGSIIFTVSSNNTFRHNNFKNIQVVDRGWLVPPWITNSSINIWDNGIEGNYWNNYQGLDYNGDGIGDNPHIINENNQDNYPLMAPIYAFDAGTWEWTHYFVDVVSNSTVSDFYFNPSEGPFLRFNATDPDGTSGFCRVTVPKGLLWTPDVWTVKINDQTVTPNIREDNENTYLYFTYSHNTKTVEIRGTDAIPEFPTWTPLLLVLSIIAVAVVIYKRKLPKAPAN